MYIHSSKISEVFEFCIKNNIECGQDGECTEIFFKSKKVIQIDLDASEEEFRTVVKNLYEDYENGAEKDNSEIWIAIENESLFKEFVDFYKHIFLVNYT